MKNARQNPYDSLRLDSQLCFPLYACSREIIKLYKPFLDELDLTYTQYVTMLVLWETPVISSRELGKRLHLDSGTFTPVLKKLEQKGLVTRERDRADERNLIVSLTGEGERMKDDALSVPQRVGSCLRLPPEDALALYTLLHRLLDSFGENGTEEG